jgi:hypothetical protein
VWTWVTVIVRVMVIVCVPPEPPEPAEDEEGDDVDPPDGLPAALPLAGLALALCLVEVVLVVVVVVLVVGTSPGSNWPAPVVVLTGGVVDEVEEAPDAPQPARSSDAPATAARRVARREQSDLAFRFMSSDSPKGEKGRFET